MFGVHPGAIDDHIEHAAAPGDEVHVRIKRLLQLRSQTGRGGSVVSLGAVGDGYLHEPLSHPVETRW